MKIEELKAYEVIERKRIDDINSESYILKHKKTGARVALLSNDDDNKVFYVGFRTPPKDSTGVAHIIEHSVLCGSEKFPVKDPFVELVKGSLNTFLNAMTYPDKTVYPVASCNEKDFENLMEVYLDAVFHPNIYENESIFRQEGWHYEFDEENSDLVINGVVYNEMKGAFSSPDDVLERGIMNSLYPDTEYGVESGGDPADIPKLTYEAFLDFHRAYYHPSNSYIYLYGDMDMAKELDYIDREYLSKYERIEVDSAIGTQKPFDKQVRTVKEFPLNDGEDEKENTFISRNYSIGDSLDKKLYAALQILDYALCSAPGAPLKQALVDRGLGSDVYSIYENGIKQPYFSIISKDIDLKREGEFVLIIDEVLKDISENGFDKKALLGAINYFEFKYREADFGSYPKGLMYGLQLLDSWLYDENKPFIHVAANDTYTEFKTLAKEGYFEGLVKKYLIDNPHRSIVVLKPKPGLLKEQEEALKAELKNKKGKMSAEELADIKESFDKLREFQEREDTKENLSKLPMLKRSDLKKEAAKIVLSENELSGYKLLYHDIFTNGIGYLRYIFKLDDIPEEYFRYVPVLKGVLGMVDTENYKYGDLFNEISLISGGITYSTYVYKKTEGKDFTSTFEIKLRSLYENIDKAVALIEEMIFASRLDDEKRLKEIFAEGKSRLQASMTGAGHSVAVGRTYSYTSAAGVIAEEMSGIAFYRLISDISENFDERKNEVISKLKELVRMIFRPENLMIDFTGEESGLSKIEEPTKRLAAKLYKDEVCKKHYIPGYKKLNEGFMTAAQVQYVCRGGNYHDVGLPYRGELRVLKVLMDTPICG